MSVHLKSALKVVLGGHVSLFVNNFLLVFFTDTDNTERGFEGCIYRMQIDNIYPLKRAFQDPRPDYMTLHPKSE
jgi:hypothetical protein